MKGLEPLPVVARMSGDGRWHRIVWPVVYLLTMFAWVSLFRSW